MISVKVFVFSILSALVSTGVFAAVPLPPRFCRAVLVGNSGLPFVLISRSRYLEVVDTRDIEFKLKRQSQSTGATTWRAEAVGLIKAPVSYVYAEAQNYQDFVNASMVLNLSNVSEDRKSFGIGFQIPLLGAFVQRVRLEPIAETNEIAVWLESGPFEGLTGRLQILPKGVQQAELRAIFQGPVKDQWFSPLLSPLILEKMTRTFLMRMRSKVEQLSLK